MDMIGHHAPREQPVPFPVEVAQRTFHERGHVRLPQPAGTVTGIEKLLYRAAQLDLALLLPARPNSFLHRSSTN